MHPTAQDPLHAPGLAALAAVVLLSSGCAPRYPGETLNTRLWQTIQVTKKGLPQPTAAAAAALDQDVNLSLSDKLTAEFIKPAAYPERRLKAVAGKEDLGIAFSGGGNRAAVCSLGQVRALRELGIMQKTRYMSCISGGSWFCVPYAFNQSKDDDLFLGRYVRPQELDLSTHAGDGTFAARAAHADTQTLKTLMEPYGDEKFAHRLDRIYLAKDDDTANEHRYFTYNAETRDDIIRRNNKLTTNDFLLSDPNKPYLIASTSIALPDRFWPSTKFASLVEMTPLYTGSPAYRKGSILSAPTGGGFVESFAYDSIIKTRIPEKDALNAQVHLPMRSLGAYRASPRFSLSDVMASSGAAPAVVLQYIPLLSRIGFPRFFHWSPARVWTPDHAADKLQSKNFNHADGGAIDNLGVIPLLRRQVHNLIVFANLELAVNAAHPEQPPPFPVDIDRLFKVKEKNWNGLFSYLTGLVRSDQIGVFAKEDYQRLRATFEAQWRSGGPLLIRDEKPYTTIANGRFGVPPGLQVKILWVFLGGQPAPQPQPAKSGQATAPAPAPIPGSLADWRSAIRDEKSQQILKRPGFSDFPYYKTFFQNSGKIIDLSHEQVKALSQYTAHMVLSQKEVFKKAAGW